MSEIQQNMVQENPMSPGPEGTAGRESAWQWATDRLLVWLILSCVSIELLGVNYILPTLGLIFAVRGFGALRRENRWLGRCYVLAVELAGDKGEWMVFHHFRWLLGTHFVGTDALQLLPAYQDSRGWTAVTGDATGRLLCERNGQTVTAPYFDLGSRDEVYETSIWGSHLGSAIYAAFSLPADGTGCRGYLAYRVYLAQEDSLLTSRLNYTHQMHRFQYPAVTALEYRQNGGGGHTGTFDVVQTALQCYGDGLVVQ